MASLRILISSGPTREPIDPVRFISNYSTGYMGARLAAEALARGHRVTVVSGPSAEPLPAGAQVVRVERAQDMERALRRLAPRADLILMAAAVSDLCVARPAPTKLTRPTSGAAGARTLRLQGTPDIIARLPRRPGQLVAGCALETGRVLPRAKRKLREKQLDLLLAQDAGDASPFGRRSVRAWLLTRDGTVSDLGTASKTRLARALLDKLEALWYGQFAERPRHRATAFGRGPALPHRARGRDVAPPARRRREPGRAHGAWCQGATGSARGAPHARHNGRLHAAKGPTGIHPV